MMLDEKFELEDKLMFDNVIVQYKLISGEENINYVRVIKSFFFCPRMRVQMLVFWMQQTKSKSLKKLIRNYLEVKYSIIVATSCTIGSNLKIEHFSGIVIGNKVVIGDNCTIYQQVTLGQKNNEYPIIGNNVTIYPGAKVLGGIKIGNNSVIGANAVVLNNVPDNAIAVGIPAKNIIKKSN